jgi:hypothetical protein
MAKIINCNFIDNLAGTYGGGAYIQGPAIKIHACDFHGNKAGLGNLFGDTSITGGALWYSADGMRGEISNSTFTGELI